MTSKELRFLESRKLISTLKTCKIQSLDRIVIQIVGSSIDQAGQEKEDEPFILLNKFRSMVKGITLVYLPSKNYLPYDYCKYKRKMSKVDTVICSILSGPYFPRSIPTCGSYYGEYPDLETLIIVEMNEYRNRRILVSLYQI